MYLPVNAAITATSLLAVSQLGISNLATNDLFLSTTSTALVARQDDAKPPTLVTSIQFITSINFITSESTAAGTTTSARPNTSSAAPTPAPVPSTTAEARTSSGQPPTRTSTIALTSSASSPTFAGTSTTTASTTPTPTPNPDVDTGPWLNRGTIAGIVVGSVFGLVILGLIIYTLFAASRGINVCDCFGGYCGKHDDNAEENSQDRLPSRSEDTFPHPDVLQCGPGGGGGGGGGYRAYRSARPISEDPLAPLPLVQPQQVETPQGRVGRLQRGYRGA